MSLGVSQVEIWGRGVDLDLFNPKNKLEPVVINLRKKLLGEKHLLAGFVGRLAQEKQVHRMQELLEISNMSFVVVGDGPERARLEQLFGKRVTFTGALTGIELAQHYAAMDIFVHFGTEETFGQTIQEAQAAGVAVVAPDRGGPRNLISHGMTGILVDPEETDGYLKAVLALQNSDRRQQLVANALAGVADRSWSKNNAELLDYYRAAATEVFTRRAGEFELA
jgi:phosphatidylinositol alpha 1,6-mannosyltransferase